MQCAAVTSTVFITNSSWGNTTLPRGWISQLEQYKPSRARTTATDTRRPEKNLTKIGAGSLGRNQSIGYGCRALLLGP